jgi:organic radical activating enzyme
MPDHACTQARAAEALTGVAAVRYIETELGAPLAELVRFPKYVYLEPVNACNARCIMCGIDFNRRPAQAMAAAVFNTLLQEIAAHHDEVRRVGLVLDGEPLLDAGLEEKIAAVKRAGVREAFLSSNASLLTRARGAALIEAGLDRIYLTVDSLKKDVYEDIRRGLRFDDVYHHVRAFIEERNRRKPGLVIRVNMVLQAHNHTEGAACIAHWTPLLAEHDQVVVRAAHGWGAALDIEPPAARAAANRIPCIALWSTLGVHSNGAVHICCVDAAGTVHVGDAQTQSIAALWRGAVFTRVRQMHLDGRRAHLPICDGCTVWCGHKTCQVIA